MSPHSILIGDAALALGLKEFTLRKACAEGVIDVPLAGRFLAFPVDRLDAYRAKLRAAGVLTPSTPHPTAAGSGQH